MVHNIFERFYKLKSKVKEGQPQFERLMNYVEKETEYLTASASIIYHFNRKHELLVHSINIAETMLELKSNCAGNIE